MEELRDRVGDKNIEFIHFYRPDECDNFLNYLAKKNISISHKCCGGKGCGINHVKKEKLNEIIQEYLQLDSTHKVANY